MSRNDTTILEQLEDLQWSLDDLLTRIIIYSYEQIVNNIKTEYDRPSKKRTEEIYKGVTDIKVTRQTLYNMTRKEHKHKTSYKIACLVRDVINQGRKYKDVKSIDLDFSELDIIVYENKVKA